jgi:hypothetical protein
MVALGCHCERRIRIDADEAVAARLPGLRASEAGLRQGDGGHAAVGDARRGLGQVDGREIFAHWAERRSSTLAKPLGSSLNASADMALWTAPLKRSTSTAMSPRRFGAIADVPGAAIKLSAGVGAFLSAVIEYLSMQKVIREQSIRRRQPSRP